MAISPRKWELQRKGVKNEIELLIRHLVYSIETGKESGLPTDEFEKALEHLREASAEIVLQ